MICVMVIGAPLYCVFIFKKVIGGNRALCKMFADLMRISCAISTGKLRTAGSVSAIIYLVSTFCDCDIAYLPIFSKTLFHLPLKFY